MPADTACMYRNCYKWTAPVWSDHTKKIIEPYYSPHNYRDFSHCQNIVNWIWMQRKRLIYNVYSIHTFCFTIDMSSINVIILYNAWGIAFTVMHDSMFGHSSTWLGIYMWHCSCICMCPICTHSWIFQKVLLLSSIWNKVQ